MVFRDHKTKTLPLPLPGGEGNILPLRRFVLTQLWTRVDATVFPKQPTISAITVLNRFYRILIQRIILQVSVMNGCYYPSNAFLFILRTFSAALFSNRISNIYIVIVKNNDSHHRNVFSGFTLRSHIVGVVPVTLTGYWLFIDLICGENLLPAGIRSDRVLAYLSPNKRRLSLRFGDNRQKRFAPEDPQIDRVSEWVTKKCADDICPDFSTQSASVIRGRTELENWCSKWPYGYTSQGTVGV